MRAGSLTFLVFSLQRWRHWHRNPKWLLQQVLASSWAQSTLSAMQVFSFCDIDYAGANHIASSHGAAANEELSTLIILTQFSIWLQIRLGSLKFPESSQEKLFATGGLGFSCSFRSQHSWRLRDFRHRAQQFNDRFSDSSLAPHRMFIWKSFCHRPPQRCGLWEKSKTHIIALIIRWITHREEGKKKWFGGKGEGAVGPRDVCKQTLFTLVPLNKNYEFITTIVVVS